jgi:hypothetical protein
MKNFKMFTVAALMAFATISVVFTSCNPDACKDVVCNNGGVCNDGSCTCEAGYEGLTCDDLSKTKFIKSWSAVDVETPSNNQSIYTCIIADGTTLNNVVISSSFADAFFTNNINATISGNTISIASQEPDSDGYFVNGTGEYSASTGDITWTYTLTDPSNAVLNYNGTWQ